MDICHEFLSNPARNPRTKRKITVNGPTFRKLVKECSKIIFDPFRVCGTVFTIGSSDTGQLGAGPCILERSKPDTTLLKNEQCIQACAGGLHTVCVTKNGQVLTFGCNDEGALGRLTENEDDAFIPNFVNLSKEFIVGAAAGDSHTAVLTSTDKVYIWGLFRDSKGPISNKIPPTLLNVPPIAKISCGSDHLVLLTKTGSVLTVGNSEQGQLGRISKSFTHRGGRKGFNAILNPSIVKFSDKNLVIVDIWTGHYTTFAKCHKGNVYAWGLNNYHQAGFQNNEIRYFPEISPAFATNTWAMISGGQHHTLALSNRGEVYAMGRKDYGQLGTGDTTGDSSELKLINIPNKCISIACGTATSFAVTETGDLYSWGMASNELGHGDEDDDIILPRKVISRKMSHALTVSAGGQHVVILAK